MEDVIRKIISIEEKAQEIIGEAIEEKANRKKEQEVKLEQLEEQILGDAKRKIDQLRTRELSENSIISEKQTILCGAKLVKMEERVEKYGEKWVEELIENILKR